MAIHPYLAFPDRFSLDNLISQEAFEAEPTAKLRTLVHIAQHHLKRDGAPNLVINAVGDLVEDETFVARTPDDISHPDKIVIYNPFPVYNYVLMKVGYIFCTSAAHT